MILDDNKIKTFIKIKEIYNNNKFLFNSSLSQDTINIYRKGSKIKIKKENKGKFTKYCKGKVTNSCILKGKNSPSPEVRKMATFADNAKHWKHKK